MPFFTAILLRPVVKSLGVAFREERAFPQSRAHNLRLRRRSHPLRRSPRRSTAQRPPRLGHALDAVDAGESLGLKAQFI